MRKHLLLTGLTLAIASAAMAAESPKPMSPQGPGMGHHMFEKMDSNGDGNISKEEHEQGLQMMLEMRRAHFNAMDKDGDGLVNKEEAQQARDTMREKFRDKRRDGCPGRIDSPEPMNKP